MPTLTEARHMLIEKLENDFGISLALGEKVGLKYCLLYARQNDGHNPEGIYTQYHSIEAAYMWFEQYGFDRACVREIYRSANFRKYFLRTRESCLLL